MIRTDTTKKNFNFISAFPRFCGLFCISLFINACASLEKPKPEPFYADAAPPPQKEFRWSNGTRLPKTFDPAEASAAPETDVARALYEGLTDTDARTLKTVPAIAVDWSSVDGNKTWTFRLRRDARWSNGERVTAGDFVRSWKRLAALGSERVPHYNLLANVAGVEQTAKAETDVAKNQTELNLFSQNDANKNLAPPIFKSNGEVVEPKSEIESRTSENDSRTEAAKDDTKTQDDKKDETKTKPATTNKPAFGAVAIDDFTLKISLLKPDKDFPALVAHPVFRPVYGDGKYFDAGRLNADIVTNGAFRVSAISQTNGITLERSENFWNRSKIELERVRLIPTENAERALEAYRAGELDAVTNADFAPLALKLLTPFDDFRRTPHGALNFYEFNRTKAPFDDRRVREALTIGLERERLTQDELDGASLPALNFLPFGADEKNVSLSQNAERARNLFAAAGFANGENFPVVRLVVNRNNVQQKVARAVAKMWKQNLNVETEIVVRENAEIEAARASGDFDVLRRGALFPTTDEAMNMLAILSGEISPENASAERSRAKKIPEENKMTLNSNSQANVHADAENADGAPENQRGEQAFSENDAVPEDADTSREIRSEADALGDFAAIPLYFPTAYSLVKPYVHGFDANTLDAPSLKDVSIDNAWQPK